MILITLKNLSKKVKLDPSFGELNFNSLSVQLVTKKKMREFIFFISEFLCKSIFNFLNVYVSIRFLNLVSII